MMPMLYYIVIADVPFDSLVVAAHAWGEDQ